MEMEKWLSFLLNETFFLLSIQFKGMFDVYEYCIRFRWIELTINHYVYTCTVRYNYITLKKILLIDGILLRLFSYFSILLNVFGIYKGFLLIRKEFLIYPKYTELIWHSGAERVSVYVLYNTFLRHLKEYYEFIQMFGNNVLRFFTYKHIF